MLINIVEGAVPDPIGAITVLKGKWHLSKALRNTQSSYYNLKNAALVISICKDTGRLRVQVILRERWAILSWSEGSGGKGGWGGAGREEFSWGNELGCSQILVELLWQTGCPLKVI